MVLHYATESLLFSALLLLVSGVRPKVTPPPFLHNYIFPFQTIFEMTQNT